MGTSSSSKTTNEPPAWSKAGYQEAGQQAQNLFNSGSGGNTFMGSTVAPLSGTTMSGVNQLANAGANTDTSASRPLFQGIGAAATSNPFQSALGYLAGNINPGLVSASPFAGVYGAAGQPSSAQSNLSNIASGAFLDPANNPYYVQALGSALDTAGNKVQSQFSGAGRLGSGANTSVLGNTLGNIAVNAANQQYNQNVQNMFGANQQIDAANQAGLNTQLGAASGITGTQAANADRGLQGQSLQGNLLSGAGNLYQGGIGQAQTAANSIAGLDQSQFQNNLTGANATLQAGNILDQQSQKNLNDLVNLFYANDNQDFNRLGMFEQALSGASGNYGSQATRTSSSNPAALAGDIIGAIPK